MENLKKVPTKFQTSHNLLTIRNYAKSQGITPTRVYQKFQEGSINIVEIDGVQFVPVL